LQRLQPTHVIDSFDVIGARRRHLPISPAAAAGAADDVIESHAHARLNSFDPLGDVYVTLLVSFMQVSFR